MCVILYSSLYPPSANQLCDNTSEDTLMIKISSRAYDGQVLQLLKIIHLSECILYDKILYPKMQFLDTN